MPLTPTPHQVLTSYLSITSTLTITVTLHLTLPLTIHLTLPLTLTRCCRRAARWSRARSTRS